MDTKSSTSLTLRPGKLKYADYNGQGGSRGSLELLPTCTVTVVPLIKGHVFIVEGVGL